MSRAKGRRRGIGFGMVCLRVSRLGVRRTSGNRNVAVSCLPLSFFLSLSVISGVVEWWCNHFEVGQWSCPHFRTYRKHSWGLRRKPRIAGHRIRVEDVAVWHDARAFADEIVVRFPQLTLGDVYAALAYYHDHGDAIRQSMREDASLAESLRVRTPSNSSKS